jgi:hypothetical protein
VRAHSWQWKKDELLRMAMAGKRVSVGFRNLNMTLLAADRCRISAAAGLNTPSVALDASGAGCCGRQSKSDGTRRRSESNRDVYETADGAHGSTRKPAPADIPGAIAERR